MMIRSNAHTHTLWCDGLDTVDAMARSAIVEGFTDLGFSSHSPAPFDPTCPGVGDLAGYRADIAQAAEKYTGRLAIATGIEQDYFGRVERDDFDYIIGAVHYMKSAYGTRFFSVDASQKESLECRDNAFKGDGFKMAETYYALVAQNTRECRPDIVAHFDVLTKFNQDGVLFDEEDARYRDIAVAALDDCIETLQEWGGMLEVNTRGMANGYRDVPYPAPFLLRRAREKRARIILSSDCHKAGTLTDGFDSTIELLKDIGFKSVAVLCGKAFEDILLD